MNVESIPKYFSPKSPNLSDESPATASDSLSITDVMAAIGMAQAAGGIGFDLFLAKIGVSSPDKAIEGLIGIARSLTGRCKPISELNEDTKSELLQLLATFAYQDYSRSAASVKECPDCTDGFIDAEVFTTKSVFGAHPGAVVEIKRLDDRLDSNISVRKREIARVQCPTCLGRSVVSSSCRCKGRGKVLDEEATKANGGLPIHKECPKCKGNGYRKMPSENVRRAVCLHVMDIPETSWRRHYKPFYETIVGECFKEESKASAALHKITR
ncbi:antitermination protein [Pectobacterium parmentieri]|uniref:antitermination protein n=1 Tax=Pectobacterium parmentieri TaxID=1905730 RepID=UPI0013745CBF|nr:antitermination protein [Pectobacterium parmentieri]QHQ14559.1 antitermination protein [Pectobacterium parmentieri]